MKEPFTDVDAARWLWETCWREELYARERVASAQADIAGAKAQNDSYNSI